MPPTTPARAARPPPRPPRRAGTAPAAALARALGHVTGRTTKELVTDRVMLEAARLLRFTDLTVQEVAHRTGFRDPLAFARAFKPPQGQPPQAYRARVQGKSMHP